MLQEDTAVRVTVNGTDLELLEGQTVLTLLQTLEIRTLAVAVERNLQIVPRAEHAVCELCDGDRVEIVTLVGGG